MALYKVLLVLRGQRTCSNRGVLRGSVSDLDPGLELELELASLNPSSVVSLMVNLEVGLAVDEVDHVVVDLVVHDVEGLVAQEVVRNSKRLSRRLVVLWQLELEMLWPVAGDVWCLGLRVEQPRLDFLLEGLLL